MAGKAAAAAVRPINARKAPDMTGVPGRIVDAPVDLVFGHKLRSSPYDALLQQLAEAGKGKALQFDDRRARAAIYSRSKKLGMQVEMAENGNALYVRFCGYAPDSPKWKAMARTAILDTVRTQARNDVQIAAAVRAKGLNEIDAGTVGAILRQMEQEGLVARQRDGSWEAKR